MPVISIELDELRKLIGRELSLELFLEKIPMMGASIERVEENKIDVEFFPNRPDLYSVEGVARALRSFLGYEKFKNYNVETSDVKLIVEHEVERIRPFILCGLVKEVELDYKAIQSIMSLQEKLHNTIGRKRRKASIGLHDFDKVKQPFIYKAVEPEEISFIPLGEKEKMNLKEILIKNDKGREFGYIVQSFDKYPIILDSEENVLSFPPIINGIITTVSEETKNIFIDCTGNDISSITQCLNIIATALAERNGKIYSVETVYDKIKYVTPDLKQKKTILRKKDVNKALELELEEEEIADCLKKMMYGVILQEKYVEVFTPRFRFDIIHPIDLIEDVAIGYGYDILKPTLSKEVTFGEALENEEKIEKIKELMLGIGFNEVNTFSLSNEEFSIFNPTKIMNPVSKEYGILRTSLIPSLLNVLKENKHRELPQKIFEIGDVVINGKNEKNFAFVIAHSKASFTEAKSVVNALIRELSFELKIEVGKRVGYIDGRCASLVKNKNNIGYFGEIHPELLSKFELINPTVGFEMCIK
ncbi:MAG: phenylalanine--tRNA ligase subunit beta [Candidatus Thermoplasmatota archaeon]